MNPKDDSMKNVVRCILAPWYLLGWISHVYLALANPQVYRNFGNTALIPALRDLWQTLVMPNIPLFALTLAAFELAVGLLIVGKGRQVRLGLIASIVFNLFLVQLGLSGQTTDWLSDFLINRLPNLIFVAMQIPLLFHRFDRPLLEVSVSYFRRFGHA